MIINLAGALEIKTMTIVTLQGLREIIPMANGNRVQSALLYSE